MEDKEFTKEEQEKRHAEAKAKDENMLQMLLMNVSRHLAMAARNIHRHAKLRGVGYTRKDKSKKEKSRRLMAKASRRKNRR